MMQSDELTDIFGAIRAACGLTETSFLQVGGTLQEVVHVLGQQAGTFETLLAELDGPALTQALERLSWSAGQVTRLGQVQDDERSRAAAMLAALDAVAGRIGRMLVSAEQAMPLAINAKILAAQLNTGEVDFSSFAEEITRTLRTTRDSLTGFRDGLQTVRERVARSPVLRDAAARRIGAANPLASVAAHAAANGAASGAIAARLTAAVAAAARQHERAGRASLTLQQATSSIRRSVGDAVGALQIGDTTRQRLEHADFALGLLDGMPPGADAAGATMFATVCRLQAAQLDASADQFQQATASITASLRKLAGDARGVRTLGDTAFAGSDGSTALFSAALETQVGAALELFASFRSASDETVQLVAVVSEATARLCRELRTVQGLEADIRIMGLNAALKCGRIGEQGRALRLIAQELCRYVDQFAGQAQALIAAVQQAAGIAATLTTGSAEAAAMTADVEHAMQHALATLREKGGTLGDALRQFDANGTQVSALLEQTLAGPPAHAQIGAAMRQAADALGRLSALHGDPGAALPAGGEALLEQIERSYTMAAERTIHDRVLGRATSRPPAPAPDTAFALEDMLF